VKHRRCKELVLGRDVVLPDSAEVIGGTIVLGDGVRIGEHVRIEVTERLVLGKGSVLGDHTVLRGRDVELGREFYTNHHAEIGGGSCFEGTSAQRSPGRAFKVAFSPSGGQGARIAYVTGRREVVVSGAGARGGGCDAQPPIWALTGLAWISAADLVVANRPAPGILAPNSYLWRYRATDDGPEELGNASIGTGAVVLDVAAAADDRMLLAVAGDPRRHSAGLGPRVMPPSRLEVWWVRVPPERGTVPRVHSRGTLLRLEGRAARRALTSGAVEIAWR